MRANGTPTWLMRIALGSLFLVWTAPGLLAEPAQANEPRVEAALLPGTTVWITDAGGLEEKTRIVGVSGGVVTARAGDSIRTLRVADVKRVRVSHSDSLINGALIGGGAAVASGLFLCSLTEPWENCLDDAGPMLRIGAIGAGAGIGIDALLRGRKTVYEAASGTRLQLAPILARHARGLKVSLSF